MAINATQKPRELIPAGNYIARCYQMIELGTITDNIQGRDSTRKLVRIGWELPEELREFDGKEKPLVISAEYTLSTHKKAILRAMLASWRGKDFTAEEAKEFDITKVIGAPCMINIIHKASETSGTVYEKISSVTPLPKSTKCPAAINAPFVLSYDEWDKAKFDSLPEFLRNRMMDSAEFQKILRPEESYVPDAADVHEPIDDLPF